MFFRTVRRGARAMLQAPFPVNAARAGDLRAVTAWRQRCATTEANPVDARFPFDEWRPLQLACAEGDAAAVETILAAGAAVDAADLSRIAPCSTGLQVAARYGHAEVCAALVAAGARAAARDRLGIAALDYAAAHGHARAVAVLLDADAACACDRARAAALARRAGFAGVATTLDAAAARAASTRTDRDKLRRWVESIGCGAFFDRLLALGYDFALVAEQGLDAADVEALGIPADKPGLAKKLRTRHRFPFAGGSAASGGGSDEDDGASDDEGEDESGSDDDDESSGSGSGSEES